MNPDLVAKSLSYHGQPLQKIWDGERGSHDLYKLGLTSPDFSVYAGRQKTLSFQDRAKRLKLHQFIARKASILFDSALANDVNIKKKDRTALCMKIVMPPYETFLSRNIDKSKQTQHVLGAIQPGDIVYGTILSRSPSGLLIKVICTGEPVVRYLADISIKAVVLAQNLVPAHDKKGNPKPYMTNDYVCCEVLDISVDADRMSLGMKGTLTIDPKAPLGSITSDQLPEYYKRLIENPEASYDELLEKSKGFENPNCVENLFQDLGLDINDTFSNMTSLKGRFPSQEYATELRQIQASKWAFRSVADGIEHFKVGRHSEAFQCLNKALSIDPRNVEGLVARGALYANSGSFKKAVEDFETALKLNPYHANARKYMGETLVALGRSYEEENRIDDARKAYTDCLNIIPHHEEAKSSLEFLNGKSGQVKQLIDTSELLPALKIPTDIKKDPEIVAKKHEESKKDKNFKKKKIKNRKRKGSTSSSSSEDSSGSSDSSSSSESSSSDSSSSSSDSETEKPKKKTRSGKSKQKSLSPISKRMALMDEQHPASGTTRYQFNQPFHLASSTNPTTATTGDDYDAKVRNFLEMTRDEDDYELRVRKLVEDASKHRKERKVDEKSKKKDKKKQKKVKKESKRDKKKKEKSKEKAELENMDLKEALKIFKSLPMLDIGSKLSTDLAKYEKSIEMLQKRRDVPSTSREVEPIVKKKSISPPPIPAARKPETPPKLPPSVKEKPKTPELVRTLPPKPPIFLDKFGCFRLAVPEEPKVALPTRRSPSPQRHRYSRSRSRSRHGRRSRSRSSRRSRSPRRSRSARRSRSPRRSRSRRRSRSGRRSRSRSVRRSRSGQRSRSRSGRRSSSVRRSYSRRSRSFSRRRMRSRSRSPVRRSPSPFVRRSRSYSVERRFRSRSRGSRRSHSYSRSRSRSPLPWRRGRRGGFRGSRGFGFRGRGRGRGRGGFRGGRRSPFVRDRSYDDSPRSRRSEEPSFKKKNRTRDSPSIEEKWTHDKYEKTTTNNDGAKSPSVKDEENWDDEPKKDTGNGAVEDTREGSTSSTGARHKSEPSPEEIDKMINQAQKDRKEEILQRDKNLLKKPTPTNLPF